MELLPSMEYFVAGALGLGLAACSGFRVFVPLLAASAAYRFGYLTSHAPKLLFLCCRICEEDFIAFVGHHNF